MITHEDITRLRRYIAEPTEANYTNTELAMLIEASALADVDGNTPGQPEWQPTYDMFRVASDIWLEKSSAVADEFDFTADGGSFQRSQKVAQYIRQSTYYKSRSKASSLQMKQRPLENLSKRGWEDSDYKDWIEEYEEGLT